MLNLTNPNVLHCEDAWARGNTDTAFACNNFVGVQRSSRSNDYNFGWVNFSAERGTYLYTPGEAYLMQQITNPVTEVVEVAKILLPNSGAEPLHVTQTYQEETTEIARILDSWATNLTLQTEFKMFGQDFELEGSLQKGNESETTKSTTKKSPVTVPLVVPPNSSSVFHVMRVTTKQEVLYGLDLFIGSDNPGGSIGKAGQVQDRWNRWFKWEDVAPDHKKQTAKYRVECTSIVTKVELRSIRTSLKGTGGAQAQGQIVAQTRADDLSANL